jgi:hypothetical protein
VGYFAVSRVRHRGGAIVLILIGLAVLAAGVHFSRTSRTPAGAQPLPGRVVDVSVKTSNFSGSRKRLYGPSVEYRDPATGESRVLPPASHQSRELKVGDSVTLMRDPATGEVRLPLPNPMSQMALPFVFGALMIALGVADLSG